jgi:hypothetical protein
MKYLKKFNEEYSRTVGFRYSEPKIEMQMTGIYVGDLSKELLELAFNQYEIKIKSLDVNKDTEALNGDEIDGMFLVNLFVYNDRKDDMESFSK